jgi:Zn-dependent oligopeptidase
MNANEMLSMAIRAAIQQAVQHAVQQEMAALSLRLEAIEQKLIKQSEKLSFISLDMRDDVINEVEKEFANRFKELMSAVKINIEL